MESSCRQCCVACFALLCSGPAGVASCFSPAVPTGDSDTTVEKADTQPGSNRTNGKRVEDMGKRSSEMIDN